MQENWQRLKPLFEQALGLPSHERIALIERISTEDQVLGAQLAALIEAHERTKDIDPDSTYPAARFEPDRCFSDRETLLGRFRIVRFIANGGMGEVYEAEDSKLGRVALKTIRADFPGSAGALARFHREISLSRRVTDNHVCRVHDLFTVPRRGGSDAVDFLTMEYIDGQTLASRIRDGPLPLEEARDIVLQLCAGLNAIHAVGIIHRDLKSSNVMVCTRTSPDGKTEIGVKIMDLGLACETGPNRSAEITGPNVVMGTLAYMAPEQFEGSPASRATDIYALGIVLYEMITGERPFPSKNPVSAAIERAKKAQPPSSLRSGIPWQWDAVILRCLEVDPERRFSSAAGVAAALFGPAEPPARAASQKRFAMGAAAGVLAIAAIVALLWTNRPYPKPLPAAQTWYERGLEALREGTYHKATHEFAQAISLDPNFLLAHVRLADAWVELDYIGKAKDEMLRASELESKLRIRPVEAKYVDAVRSALTFDYATSLKDYRDILNRLPAAEKPYGYMDVGRAYEKAGDIGKAAEIYKQAARLAPEYPASFVRLAILQARKGAQPAADAAFSRAKDLYSAANDVEGQAEVAYQRAYALGLTGQYKQANHLLEEVLATSRAIHSSQLEIRALLLMSTEAYNSDNYSQSADLAQRAIDLAREKDLEYWVIDGLVRLGNAWLSLDWTKAEPSLDLALRRARDSQRPRLEAAARLSLASIRSQQGKLDECLALARSSFDYYSRAGFSADAMRASLLLVRIERDKADYRAALPDAMKGLDVARKSANDTNILLFEELTGSVLLELEKFSDALPHFEAALRIADKLSESIANERLYSAEALFRLGRYGEAKAMLDSIPADSAAQPRITAAMDRVEAWMNLTRLDFRGVAERARRGLHVKSAVSDDLKGEFQLLEAESALAGGNAAEAESGCRSAAAAAAKSTDPDLAARANLCLANAGLVAHSPQTTLERAHAAVRFFAGTGQLESESFALLALAKAYRVSGDKSRTHEFALKALDLLNASMHNQGNSAGDLYSRRPDIAAAREELERLSRE